MKFEDLRYFVRVERLTFETTFDYAGLKKCQLFIKLNGKPNKNYKIRVVKKVN